MPGPISDSYPGPTDERPVPPRWAFPHLSDDEYEEMARRQRGEEEDRG